MRVAFELMGEMPLLMHNDNVIAADALGAWRKDPAHKNVSKAGDDRSPAWSWRTYLYSDGEYITIPSDVLMANLRYAGTQVILKRQKTFKELSQSGLLTATEYLDFFIDGKQVPIKPFDWLAASRSDELIAIDDEIAAAEKHGFQLFVKRAGVGQAKHVRVRPRFDRWSVRGEMDVLVPEITLPILQQFFEFGGRGGICDWRPNGKTPGPYGMYSAKVEKI